MTCLQAPPFICMKPSRPTTLIPHGSTTATFQCGDHISCFLINGCFVTLNLVPDAATWFAAWRCPGGHCFAILDFCMDVLLGDHLLRIVHPDACHLSCTVPPSITAHFSLLSGFLVSHNFLPSLHWYYSEHHGPFTLTQARHLNGLDVL